MVGDGEVAHAVAKVCLIAGWCDDPIVPVDAREIHVHPLPFALRLRHLPGGPFPTHRRHLALRPVLVLPVVRVRVQDRLRRPPRVHVFGVPLQADVPRLLALAGDLHEDAVIVFRILEPSACGRQHVHAHRRVFVRVHHFRVYQPGDRTFLSFNARPNYVAYHDPLIPFVVGKLHNDSFQDNFGCLQHLLLGYAVHVEL